MVVTGAGGDGRVRSQVPSTEGLSRGTCGTVRSGATRGECVEAQGRRRRDHQEPRRKEAACIRAGRGDEGTVASLSGEDTGAWTPRFRPISGWCASLVWWVMSQGLDFLSEVW